MGGRRRRRRRRRKERGRRERRIYRASDAKRALTRARFLPALPAGLPVGGVSSNGSARDATGQCGRRARRLLRVVLLATTSHPAARAGTPNPLISRRILSYGCCSIGCPGAKKNMGASGGGESVASNYPQNIAALPMHPPGFFPALPAGPRGCRDSQGVVLERQCARDATGRATAPQAGGWAGGALSGALYSPFRRPPPSRPGPGRRLAP